MSQTRSVGKENRGIRSFWIRLVLCLAGVCLSGCAPSLYSIDLRYQPSGAPVAEMAGSGKVRVTVASFEDHRRGQEQMLIGRVIRLGGSQVAVAPKYRSQQDAVANGFKEYVAALGFTVSGEKPRWNGESASIQPDWGDVVIGGSIDELDITCNDGLPTKTYTSRIKLTVYFADVTSRHIFYKTTAQSSASLEHVLFSEDRMQQQLNEILTTAIEKVFEGGKAQRSLLERGSPKS